MKKIVHNRIQCTHCKDIIESKRVHDFVSCECGICFVDGGSDYQRIGFKKQSDFKDLSEWEGEDDPIPVGVVKDAGDEWVLITDQLPKSGELVLWLTPDHPEKPMFMSKFDPEIDQWRCAHCNSRVEKPNFWKRSKLDGMDKL